MEVETSRLTLPHCSLRLPQISHRQTGQRHRASITDDLRYFSFCLLARTLGHKRCTHFLKAGAYRIRETPSQIPTASKLRHFRLLSRPSAQFYSHSSLQTWVTRFRNCSGFIMMRPICMGLLRSGVIVGIVTTYPCSPRNNGHCMYHQVNTSARAPQVFCRLNLLAGEVLNCRLGVAFK